VAGHKGDVGNELADRLANLAADGHPLGDQQNWMDAVLAPGFSNHAAWFWLFYSPQFDRWWNGHDLRLPLQATSMPTVAVLPSQPACTPCTSQRQLDCTIGTCNVLTMKATSKPFDDELGFSGPSRQQIVLQQFKDANVCIFALQETRLRQCSKNLLGYLLFRGTRHHTGTTAS